MSPHPEQPTQHGDATRPHMLLPVEELRAEMQRRWAAGDPVEAEKLLPSDADPTLTLPLVLEELSLRRARGVPLNADEYRRRWPAIADEIERHLHAEDSSAITADGNAVGPPPPPVEPIRVQVPGYEIERMLGRGGMGIVYLARQTLFNRRVALKMIVAGSQASEEDLARFQTEAQAIARLNHTGIVQVYDIGEWLPESGSPLPYFSMEFCPGGSLSAKLGGNPQSPKEAARLALTLARAVEAAHAAGIVHRDLKPSNVLLAEDGTPKITDFGLAKKLDDDSQTRSGAIMGTPGYMAPEQAAGKTHEIGPSADLYALGAILYEMLVGRVPFKGSSVVETLDMVRNREPVGPSALQPRVPRDLETICLKCLQKAPDRRYASAKALADDLERFIQDRPILARPVGLAERGWRWARRHRALAGLYAVSAAASLALVAGGFWFSAWLGAANAKIDTAAARADLADVQADNARRLSATQRYFGLLNQVRARAARHRAGWRSSNLADLAEAAKLPDAVANLPELRSEAAECLIAVDVERKQSILPGTRAYSAAWHPDGHRLALGERASGFILCSVNVIDLRRPGESRTLWLTPRVVPRKGALPAPDIVLHLAFTPDGRWLIAGMRSGMLHRWRIDKDETKSTAWEAGKEEIRGFALSTDGRRLTTSCENVLTTWDTTTWTPMAVRTFDHRIDRVVELPEEGELLCVADGWHRLEAHTLEPTRPMEPRPEGMIEALPGGRLLGTTSSMARVIRLDLSTAYGLIVPDLGTTHETGGIRISTNSTGDLAVTATSGDPRARLWDLVSGAMLADVPFAGGDGKSAFSPDGRSFVLLGTEETILYRIRGLREADTAVVFPQSALWFDTHPDGRSLLSVTAYGAPQQPFQELAQWVLGSHPISRAKVRWPVGNAFGNGRETRVGLTGPDYRISHAHEVPGADESAVQWENLEGGTTSTWKSRKMLTGGFAHTADGCTWLTQKDEVVAFDRNKPTPSLRWRNVFGEALTGKAHLFGLAVGAKRLSVASRDGTLRVFPLDGTKFEPKSSVPVTSAAQLVVAMSADERLALVGSERGELTLVDLDSGRVVAHGVGHESEITAVLFAPGGLLLSAAADSTIRVWHHQGDQLREQFRVRLYRSVRHMKLLPDGVTLLVLLARERGVRRLRLDQTLNRFHDLGLGAGLPRLIPIALPAAELVMTPAFSEMSDEKGFRMELFSRPGLSGLLEVRADSAIDHDWSTTPPDPRMRDRGYSVRWTGQLTAPSPGRYKITLQGAEGMRLWLDGRKRIDLWPNRGPGPFTIVADFTTEPQELRIEVNQLTGQPKPLLTWSGPGLTARPLKRPHVISAKNVSQSRDSSK